jgi:hypothetical protein
MVDVKLAQPHWQLLLARFSAHPLELGRTDAATLECRGNDDVTHVQLVGELIQTEFAARMIVVQHDRLDPAASTRRKQRWVVAKDLSRRLCANLSADDKRG